MAAKDTRKTFLDIPAEDVEAHFLREKIPAFRLKQIHEWLFRRRAASFAEMSDVPAALRASLDKLYRLHALSVVRKEESKLDGTIRYFFRGHDGSGVSTVYLP